MFFLGVWARTWYNTIQGATKLKTQTWSLGTSKYEVNCHLHLSSFSTELACTPSPIIILLTIFSSLLTWHLPTTTRIKIVHFFATKTVYIGLTNIVPFYKLQFIDSSHPGVVTCWLGTKGCHSQLIAQLSWTNVLKFSAAIWDGCNREIHIWQVHGNSLSQANWIKNHQLYQDRLHIAWGVPKEYNLKPMCHSQVFPGCDRRDPRPTKMYFEQMPNTSITQSWTTNTHLKGCPRSNTLCSYTTRLHQAEWLWDTSQILQQALALFNVCIYTVCIYIYICV